MECKKCIFSNGNECDYKLNDELIINGRRYDGCRASRKNLPNDVCDKDSIFCKKIHGGK